MPAHRPALAAMLAASLLAGCASSSSTGEEVDPATDAQLRARVELMGTLRGVELEENIRMLGEYLRGVAVPYLVEAVQSHSDPKVRAGCASALGLTSDGRAVPPLAAAAEGDSDSGVRYTAAYSLLLLRDPRGFTPLFETLRSDDPLRRRVGIDRLRQLTNLDHGFDPAAPPEQREAAVKRWEAWLGRVGLDGAAMTIQLARRAPPPTPNPAPK
jgi:HEAT repeat protein